MNLYRTGGDIGPAFTSVIGESYATVQYNDRPDPFSRPGCWACEYNKRCVSAAISHAV